MSSETVVVPRASASGITGSIIWAGDLAGAFAEVAACLAYAMSSEAVHWFEIEDGASFALRCRVEPREVLAFLCDEGVRGQGPFLGWNPPTRGPEDVVRRSRDPRYSPFCNWWGRWTVADGLRVPLHVRVAFAVITAVDVVAQRSTLAGARIRMHRCLDSPTPPGVGGASHLTVDVDAVRSSAGFRVVGDWGSSAVLAHG